MKNVELVRRILGSESHTKSMVAGALLDVFEKAETKEERKKLLAIALTERDTVPKQPYALDNKDIVDEAWDDLNKTHLEMIRGHLKMAFFRSSTAHEFSGEILRLVDFFEDRNAKIFLLGTVLYSSYVPYRELPGTPKKLSEHQAKHLTEANKEELDMIRYIAGIKFNSIFEETSVILQTIDGVKNNDLRIVMLALYIVSYIKKNNEN